jgi:glutamate-ammonia-ligase adenylyltransferase
MRRLIAEVKGETDFWDLKLVSGGLIEIEFLAQYLVLSQAHRSPDMICTGTREMIDKAQKHQVIEASEETGLLTAHTLYTSALQMQRLTLDPNRRPEDAPPIVKQRLAKAAGEIDFGALESRLRESRRKVRYLFDALLMTD